MDIKFYSEMLATWWESGDCLGKGSQKNYKKLQKLHWKAVTEFIMFSSKILTTDHF